MNDEIKAKAYDGLKIGFYLVCEKNKRLRISNAIGWTVAIVSTLITILHISI